MKRTHFFGTLCVTLSLATPAFAFELLDRMLGAAGCGCEVSCCEVTSCAKPAPSCGFELGPTCAAPTCGQEAPTCGVEKPTCGCDITPSCGSERKICVNRCRTPLLSNLKQALCTRSCQPNCTTVEPTCAAPPKCCDVAAPTCGSDHFSTKCRKPCLLDRLFSARKCGCSTCSCTTNPTCGAEADCSAQPSTQPVPAPTTAPAPPAEVNSFRHAPLPEPDTSVRNAFKSRVIQASAVSVK